MGLPTDKKLNMDSRRLQEPFHSVMTNVRVNNNRHRRDTQRERNTNDQNCQQRNHGNHLPMYLMDPLVLTHQAMMDANRLMSIIMQQRWNLNTCNVPRNQSLNNYLHYTDQMMRYYFHATANLVKYLMTESRAFPESLVRNIVQMHRRGFIPLLEQQNHDYVLLPSQDPTHHLLPSKWPYGHWCNSQLPASLEIKSQESDNYHRGQEQHTPSSTSRFTGSRNSVAKYHHSHALQNSTNKRLASNTQRSQEQRSTYKSENEDEPKDAMPSNHDVQEPKAVQSTQIDHSDISHTSRYPEHSDVSYEQVDSESLQYPYESQGFCPPESLLDIVKPYPDDDSFTCNLANLVGCISLVEPSVDIQKEQDEILVVLKNQDHLHEQLMKFSRLTLTASENNKRENNIVFKTSGRLHKRSTSF